MPRSCRKPSRSNSSASSRTRRCRRRNRGSTANLPRGERPSPRSRSNWPTSVRRMTALRRTAREGRSADDAGPSRQRSLSGRSDDVGASPEPGNDMKRVGIRLVLGFGLGGVEVAAQDKYPSKPVKVVVPFGPGSATDIVMRIVGEHMRPILGQPVVIENKPGAFGILAIEEMARSRPDGYTLQIGNPATNVLAPIIYKKKFKIGSEKDVTLVTRLSEVPLVLGATTKDFPPKTYAEFIAYAKANPGKVRYASVGIGSNNHYDMEAFARWAGIVLA